MDRAVPRASRKAPEVPFPRGGNRRRSGPRSAATAVPAGEPGGHTRSHRDGVLRVAAALAFAAALGTAAAPEAAATATQMRVLGDINFGSSTTYGTGCTYTVQVLVTNAVEPVTLLDNGIPIAVRVPDSGNALFTWIPAVPGPHRLEAVQAPDREPTVAGDVRVGTGTHLGYACVVNGG